MRTWRGSPGESLPGVGCAGEVQPRCRVRRHEVTTSPLPCTNLCMLFPRRDGGTVRRSGLKMLQAAPELTGEVLSFLSVSSTYERRKKTAGEVR